MYDLTYGLPLKTTFYIFSVTILYFFKVEARDLDNFEPACVRVNHCHVVKSNIPLCYSNTLILFSYRLRLVPSQHVQIFYAGSHLRVPQNGHAIISTKFLKGLFLTA